MITLYWLLGGVVALSVGGLVGLFWDPFKKILFNDFGALLLKFYTFGSKRLETKLFKYIAMRPKKDASLLLLNLALWSLVIGVCVHELEGPKFSPSLWIKGLLLILLLIGHPFLKVLYCEFFTLRFDYYMALGRPYFSNDEYYLYQARFASIESKQQHMELCDEVKLKGKQAKLARESAKLTTA